jgi:hypothetical protein
MRPANPAIRWSLNRAAEEFRTTVVRLRRGLKARGVTPDSKNTYATHEIASALYERDDLERRAKAARWQMQIDLAQAAREKVLENKRELLRASDVSEFFLDVQTVIVQIIRHSKLSDPEKEIIFRKLKDAPNELERGEHKQ